MSHITDPEPAANTLARAEQFLAAAMYAEAIDLLAAVESHPSIGPKATYLRACALMNTGPVADAEQRFHQLMTSGYQRANCAYYLGEIALRQGASAYAVCLFSGAIVFDPQHRSARQRLDKLAPLLGVSPTAPAAAPSAPSAPTTAPTPPARPPREPRSPSSTIGLVTAVRGPIGVPTLVGVNSAQELHIDFTEYDRQGAEHGPRYVYLRGVKISGFANKGHWIEIDAKPDKSGRVRRLRNMTTNTELGSKSSRLVPGS